MIGNLKKYIDKASFMEHIGNTNKNVTIKIVI